MRKYLIYLILLIPFSGCTEWDIFHDNTHTAKTYQLKEFNNIILDGIFEVELYQSEELKVIVEGSNDQIRYTSVSTEDGTLKINHNLGRSWISGYNRIKLKIYADSLYEFKNLKPIQLFSQDTLRSEKLRFILLGELNEMDIMIDTDNFLLRNSLTSTGNLKISGHAGYARIMIEGSTHLDARELITQHTRIVQYSIADAFINVRKKLSVDGRASGDVFYLGSPEEIITDLKADGKVFPYSSDQ